MNFLLECLNAIDLYAQGHLGFSVAVVMFGMIWGVFKRYGLRNLNFKDHAITLAVLDLMLFPLAFLCMGGLVFIILQNTDIERIASQIQPVFQLLAVLAVFWIIARFVEIYILSKSKRDDFGNYLPGLQRGLLFASGLLIGFIVFANIKGYSITGIYVSTGAVAAMIAFATQRTLVDLFSGIALSVEHPFRLGDWIELADGTQGQVIDINWRATRLSTWENATLIVPNSELARQPIKNLYGIKDGFAPWYKITIAANADPIFVKNLLLEAVLRCDKVLKDPSPSVRLVNAGSLPYTYMIWVHFRSFFAMFAGREEMFTEIHYSLKKAGIQVAPNMHEVHTKNSELINIEPPTTLKRLRDLNLTHLFDENALLEIASMGQLRTYDAGTVLVREGDLASSFDIILSGVVESSIGTNTGSSENVDRLKAGQFFGITAMVIDNPSFMEFTAKTEVTLIRLDLNCFRELLRNREELSNELAKIVKQRMDATREIKMMSHKHIQRLTLEDILKRMEKILH